MRLLKRFSVNSMVLLTFVLCFSFAVNVAASGETLLSSSSVSAPGSIAGSGTATISPGRYGNPTVSGMKTISRPSEIDDLEVQDAGLILYNMEWDDWTTINVPEKGWVIMDTTYPEPGVYVNSSFIKRVNFQYWEENIGNTTMRRFAYYLDKGIYYITPAAYATAGTLFVYAYFIPSSSVLSVKASLAQDCSSAALHCTSAMGTGTLYRWVKDVSTTDKITEDDFYPNKSAVADFDVEENGTYSVQISSNDQEWKNYPVDVQITVSGIVPKPKECEHEYETVTDQEPTCGKAGSQHQECTICGQKEASTAIPATGNHTYGDWTVVEQPTTTKTGTKQRTCSVCGTTETAAIEKLAETESNKTDGANTPAGNVPSGSNVPSGNVPSGTNTSSGNASSGVTAPTETPPSEVSVPVESMKTIQVKLNSKKNVNVKKGQKLKVKAKGVPKKKKVTFRSSNKKVATVNAKGIIKAKKAGKTTIIVRCGKKESKITIKVK